MTCASAPMLQCPPMAVSSGSIQVLTANDAVARLGALRSRQPVNYWAFYSSQLGGIVTDPALMVIPFDDHMVHRGHRHLRSRGLVDGKIYDLECALDRFLRSAERSKLGFSARAKRCANHRENYSRRGRPTARFALVCRQGRAASSSRRRRAPSRLLRHGVAACPIPSGGTPRV